MNPQWKVLKKLAKSEPAFAAGVVMRELKIDLWDQVLSMVQSHQAIRENVLRFHLIFRDCFSEDWMNDHKDHVRSCIAGERMVAHIGFEKPSIGMIVEAEGDAFALFTENVEDGSTWHFVGYYNLGSVPVSGGNS